MTSPVNLSHSPSVVTPKFSSTLSANADPIHRATSDDLVGGVGPALAEQGAAAPRSATPPAASSLGIAAAADTVAPAPAPAPVESLSFAPIRAPSPVDLEAARAASTRASAAEYPAVARASSPGLRGSDEVVGSAAALAFPPPLLEAAEEEAPLSTEEAPSVFASVCNRISTGVTEFVNWIASFVYPSSVEDVSDQASVAVAQPQVQEVSASADAKKAAKGAKQAEEAAPSIFTTVYGRISNFITAAGEWMASFFVAAQDPALVAAQDPTLSESERRLDAAVQVNEAAVTAARDAVAAARSAIHEREAAITVARNAVAAAQLASDAAGAAAGRVLEAQQNIQTTLADIAIPLDEEADSEAHSTGSVVEESV